MVYPCILLVVHQDHELSHLGEGGGLPLYTDLLVHQDHELLHQGEGGGLPLYTVTSPPRS